jgi:SAM-dependent methyltransferase
MLGRAARQGLKTLLPRKLVDQLVLIEAGAQAFRDVRGRYPRECSICGYKGLFWAKGRQPIVLDGQCPSCRSVGRHRQHQLLIQRHPDWLDGCTVLHFAPEPCFAGRYSTRIAASGGEYVRADYMPKNDEAVIDLQDIAFPDAKFDTVIVHNVLEHVPDDALALREIRRVLKPGGRALLSVPLFDAWDETYEDAAISSESGRDLHFNQKDHLRLYGRDFRDRLTHGGFAFETYVAKEPEVSRYGLERGETIFICTPQQ